MEFKQDINFLEYPLWMQRERDNTEIAKFTDIEGYTFEATGGVPSKVDILFLYYMLSISQQKDWSQKLTFSKYEILDACGVAPSTATYKRLEDSLHKWWKVNVSFSGTFYTGEVYSSMHFNIIDYYGFNETNKKLEIRLSPEWLEKIKASEFYKFVSFDRMKELRSPLALRLYEILGKTFYKRDVWEIDVLKLAAKIPMAEKYFADVVPKIEAATKRIKEKTELNIIVKVVKHSRGQGKFIFTKKEKKGKLEAKESSCELLLPQLPEPPPSVLKTPQLTQPQPPTPPSLPIEILNLIPEEWRENVIAEAERILKLSGEETIKRCIQKINHSIKKGTEIGSYGGYLRRCHDEKWYEHKSAEEIKAEKEAIARQKAELLRQKENEERRRKEEHEILKQNFDEETTQLAVERFNQLHPTEQTPIIEEFESSMNSFTKTKYLEAKKNIESSIFVKSAYHLFLKTHLLSEDEKNFDLWLESRCPSI